MAPLPYTRALGALLAAFLLCCCSQMATAQLPPAWTSRFVLAPVPGMVANAAPRLEINDLVANTRMFSVFVQALSNLQVRPVSRLDSYTAICGIHGSPTAYDGAPGNNGGGYCPHRMQFFSMWHRPFLSILEQALYEEALRVAETYTVDRDAYRAVARSIRLPLWDSARAGGVVPSVLTRATVSVNLAPSGAPTTVRNPLVTYTIPNDAISRLSIRSGFATITRDPSWVTNYQQLLPTLRSETLAMFQATTHACFVRNTGSCTNPGSLEGTHNRLHGIIGGNSGHMSFIDVAAHDPIFWLHHCNVDRQLAIWEAINPAATMGSIADTSATPFRRGTSRTGSALWYRTRDVAVVYTRQSTRARWGYYYRELENAVTPAQLRTLVDQLYNDNRGQALTIMSIDNPAQGTGTVNVSLAATSTTTAPATRRQRAGKPGKTTRRVRRRVVVQAGQVKVVTANDRRNRFTVSRVNVDVTDALQKLKDASLDGLTSVDIIATLTPANKNGNDLPSKINLGQVIISTLIDGKVVATNAPVPPVTAVRLENTPVAKDVKLFDNVSNVTATVKP